jgi:hypothetical protein
MLRSVDGLVKGGNIVVWRSGIFMDSFLLLASFLLYGHNILGRYKYVQDVRMKGVQNKIIIYQKEFFIHINGLQHYKGKL